MKSSANQRALGRMRTRLELRGLRPNSIEAYLGGARRFLQAVDKSPGQIRRADVERYLLGLRAAGRSVSTRNVALSSIRFLLQSTTSKDVTVSIPRAKAPRTLMTVLSAEEVERFTDAEYDLAPLTCLPDLEIVNVSPMYLTQPAERGRMDLTPVRAMRGLTTLRLRGMEVEDVTPLQSHPSLLYVDLSGTAVTDLSALATISTLERLGLERTAVTDLSPLAGSPIKVLTIDHSPIEDLGPLGTMPRLEQLDAEATAVTNIQPLVNIASLASVNLRGSPLTDLTPLSKMTALQRVNLDYLKIDDLSALAGHPALESLSVIGTQVRDVKPLASCPKLRFLHVAKTPAAKARDGLCTQLPDVYVEFTTPADWLTHADQANGTCGPPKRRG